jgi:hypothetical protein
MSETKFRNVAVINRRKKTIRTGINKNRQTGSLLDKKSEVKTENVTEEKFDEIGAEPEHSHRKSLR